MDANGDMKIDLLGLISGDPNFKVWENAWNSSKPSGPMFSV
jgi:hypothetical protein